MHPATPLGMALGIAASITVIAALMYSIRRAMPFVRKLGPTQHYLRLHVWAGVLFVAMFLGHTAFRLPSTPFYLVLWTTTNLAVLSGLIGLALQRTIPRVLQHATSIEVNLQRIPELVADLRRRSEILAEAAEPRVNAYYRKTLAADMASPRITTEIFRNPKSAGRTTGEVDILRQTLTAEGMPVLDTICELRATKHELDVHFTLQTAMRIWLFLHLPVAVVMAVLIALHIFFVVYF